MSHSLAFCSGTVLRNDPEEEEDDDDDGASGVGDVNEVAEKEASSAEVNLTEMQRKVVRC